MVFYAYMLHCADGSYYTGHTDDLEARIAAHDHGAISGYTRTRRPVRLVWSQEFGERHEALSAERQIKGWSRAKKEALIDRRWDEVSRLAKARGQIALRSRRRRAAPPAQDERGEVCGYVARSVMRQMNQAALAAHPLEACGILLGEGGSLTHFIQTANVHPSPQTHFEIDPQALIDAHREAREGGAQVLGYFHSHPKGPAEPSQTDASMAAGDGKIWAIWGEGALTFWRDEVSSGAGGGAGGFCQLSYAHAQV